MRLPLSVQKTTQKNRPGAGSFFELDLTVVLAALALFLSALEYLIPKPLPFLRLGVANLPLLMALSLLPARRYALLVLLKIAGQGLISGTLFSWIMVFSAGGSIAAAIVMYGLHRLTKQHLSLVGISVAGAFASTAAQLLLARWWIFGAGAWYIAPPFLAAGLVSGTLLGLFANSFVSRSRWLAAWNEGLSSANCTNNTGLYETPKGDAGSSPSTGAGAAAGSPSRILLLARSALALILSATLLFSRSIPAQVAATVLASILLLAAGRRIHLIPLFVMTAGIIAFNLAVPVGRVLFEIGRFPITLGALETGIKKALAVEGMIFVSRWFLSAGLRLPGRFGRLSQSVLARLDRLFETGRTAALAVPRRNWLRDPAGSVDAVLLSCVPVPDPR